MLRRRLLATFVAAGLAVLVIPAIASGYTISGNKFVDNNADGVDAGAGDAGRNGVTIYADLNDNNVLDAGEPTAVTAGSGGNTGNYTLTTTAAQPVHVREVQEAGWTCSIGTIGDFDTCERTAGTVGSTANVTGIDFGNFQPVTILGTKFEDLNANGTKDGAEGALSGVTIYFDANNNNVRDAGETSTTTAADGNWTLSGIPPGTRTVREELPAGYACTAPSTTFANCEFTRTLGSGGSSATGNNFGNAPATASISGTKFEDVNANGIKDTGEPAISGVTIYIDANGNNTFDSGTEASTTTALDGTYSFNNLTAGTYAVREVLPTGYECSTPSLTFTACEYNRTLAAGGSSNNNDFGNFRRGSISGTKFNDPNANGTQDSGELGIQGVTIYLDLNNDNVRQTGGGAEPSTTTDASGNWSFTNLVPGSYSVREVLPANSICTAPGTIGDFSTCEFNLNLTSNQSSAGHAFGNVAAATISGTKFEDLDADGIKDGGEPGLSGVTIYLDTNNNDTPDAGEPSTTTAGNGNYSFSVVPGSYTVREVLPPGYECSVPAMTFANCEYSVTVAAGGSSTGNHFGNFRRASISGLKFEDLDGSGIQDVGENPIEGVTIYLDGSGGQPQNDQFDAGETSTTTAANGTYSFTNLVPGNYSVREVPPAGYACTAPSPSPANCEFNFTPLTSGTNSTGNNFGNAQPGSISGSKFEDTNGNGIQDGIEGPLQGVTIYLDANNNDAFDTGEPSTSTDGSGNWTLSDIAPGSRTVREVPPDGYVCTAPSATFANCEFTHNLTSGQSISGDSFGNAPAPIISGSKFEDSNGNAAKDAGEPPIQGVRIYDDANGNDSFDSATEASVLTDANGDWSLIVTPGDHTVREVPPTGSECSTPGTIGDASSCEFSVTGINYGQTSSGHDFGNFARTTISGRKFEDLNGNGSKSGPEPLLQGVTIYLDANGNDQFDSATEASDVTDANGAWSFDNLAPGNYSVREVAPTGYICTGPSQIDANCEFNVALTSGTPSTGHDFGNAQPATISGQKFEDEDADSVKDAGEPGVSGVQIYMDANNNNAFDTGEVATTTDGSGNYSFSVAPGTYHVRETLPTGYQCSFPSTNFGNCEYTETVTSNQTLTGRDFGNFRLASIAGKKFEDLDGSGSRDVGEPGIQGVTIYIDENGNNTMDSGSETNNATTTDANGDYSFTNLHPGNFSIREVLPTGYSCTTPSSTFANCEYNFTPLTSGTNSTNNDFGNDRPGTISGTKFHDLNANGTQDAGENPISGVTIYLDADGSNSFDSGTETSTTTAVDGTYSFNLPPKPAPYIVREVPPTGYECSTPGTIGDASSCEHSVAVTSNGSFTGKDFGNFQRASISGLKFHDLNADGTRDAGEDPISGVTIYLDADGSNTFDSGTEASTTTAADGTYSLTNLVPGNYTVREEPPTGYNCSAPSLTFANCEHSVTVASGDSSTGNDFGNYQPATVSGTKFADLDGDGTQDAGEGPLEGVTIYLDANDNNSLDSGETSTTTNASGNWSFTNLVPGTFTEREVPPTGTLCSAPSANFANCEFSQTLTSGQTDATGQDFGNVQAAAISGTKFEDLTGNGVKDGADGPLQGVTIYLDTNDDNGLDAGEPQTTTDASGNWSFSGLFPGTYTVREVAQSDHQCTVPSSTFANCEFTETLSPGESDSTGQDFGNFPGFDLAITKTDSADPVNTGDPVTYTITVTNNGAGTATGVTVTDTLPAGMTFVSASAGCTNAAGTVTCTIGSLNAAAQATVTIDVTASSAGTLSNTASVQGNEFDGNSVNDSATENTTVNTPGGGGGGGGGGAGGGITGGGGGSTGGGTTGGATITGTRGSDHLTGTPGNDVIVGGGGNDVINGGGGNDTIIGGSGSDTLNGGAGNDTLVGDSSTTPLAADSAAAGGNDRLIGGAGKDTLKGQAGNDLLKGEGGKDKLLGGPGNDSLIGGPGTDQLKPGSGRNKVKQ